MFQITTGFVNFGGNTFNGLLGLGLYLGDSLVSVLIKNDISLSSYYGDTNFSVDSLSIPSTLAEGTYRIYGIYKATGDGFWSIMKHKIGTPNSLDVTVTSTDVTFSTPNDYPNLTLMEPIKVIGNLYSGKKTRVRTTIQNTGTEYNSYLILKLCSPIDGATLQLVNIDPINIPAGATKTIELTGKISVAPGNYTLSLLYDLNNDQDNYSLNVLSPGPNNTIGVSVINDSLRTPALSLTQNISLKDSTLAIGSNATLTTRIKNTGSLSSSTLVAFIYPQKEDKWIDYMGPVSIVIDTNEEKIVTISKIIDLADGTYKLKLYHSNDTIPTNWDAFTPDSSSTIQFTVSNIQTQLEKSTFDRPILYPNPATEDLTIQSTSLIKSIVILEISGNPILIQTPQKKGTALLKVGNLNKGIYLIKIRTEEGTFTEKFIKK